MSPAGDNGGGDLGGYQLRCMLERGGTGSVYLGVGPRGSQLRRAVAIKALHPELAGDAEAVAMFRDEGELSVRIDHPFVIRAIDGGEDRGRHFLVMDYAVGEPLTRVLDAMRGSGCAPQRAEIVARIVADLCEGVHAIHSAVDIDGAALGLVHRDLSAGNLFAMYDGTVRVADLGIASGRDRFARDDEGVFRGKMGYAAPEALHGAPADPVADVWSLGVVLWELLARQRLFPSASERVRNAILDLTIPAPSGFSGDVPYELDSVATRALARDPGARYPTARAMAAGIHDALIELSPAISYGAIAGFVAGLIPDGLARHRELMRQAITGADGW